MAIHPAPELDTAAAVLDHAGEAARAAWCADAQTMYAACCWADQHPCTDPTAAATAGGVEGFGDRAITVAGSHAPMVGEFAVAELAARIGRTTAGGGALIGESVFCRHLLPTLWRRVQALQVDGWRARLVARACIARDLTPEAATYVDTHVAHAAPRVGATVLGRLVEEAVARFMPAQAEAEREAAQDGRRFEVHLDGSTGDLSGTSVGHLCWAPSRRPAASTCPTASRSATR